MSKEMLIRKQEVLNGVRVCRALGDEQRLEIMIKLTENNLCVGELSKDLQLSGSAMSHQLRILKDANLVTRHKKGKNAIYSLNNFYLQQLSEDWLFRLLFYQDKES